MTEPNDRPTITLRDGRTATVRLLRPTDVEPFAAYLTGLSERTRGFYGPHAFDRATAEGLCAATEAERTRRYVAVLEDGTPEAQIIGYIILTRNLSPGDVARYASHGPTLDVERCAAFAPSVADAFQEQGIGTQMGQHVLAYARDWGLRQVILMGGVQSRNVRGRRMYERLGFRKVGEFETVRNGAPLGNLDMICEL